VQVRSKAASNKNLQQEITKKVQGSEALWEAQVAS
jgi:hypothetical protein